MREGLASMFGRLNHVALAVPDLDAAVSRYRALGAQVSEPQALPEHGVTVVFIAADNTKIELLHPLEENSPIAAFSSGIRAAARIISASRCRIFW